MTRALLILGMHRSFTSLTARWLMESGLDIGTSLLVGSTGNPDGHFEDTRFLTLHEEILVDNGLPADGLKFEYDRTFDHLGFENLTVTSTFRRRAQAIIDASPTEFGWKEPRTCLFLPMYRDLLPGAHSLIVVRHFDAVVRSLVKRDRKLLREGRVWHRISAPLRGRFRNHDAFLGAWIHYNRRLLEHARLVNSKIVVDLVGQSREVASWLRDCGFTIDPVPIETIALKPTTLDSESLSFAYDADLVTAAQHVLAEFSQEAGR